MVSIKMSAVELHDAFLWDCDDCGRENIVRCIPVINPDLELSEELIEQIRADLGMQSWEAVGADIASQALVRIPYEVACKHCESKFDAIPPGGFMEE
tara:strand:+ start:464 stop:754 length:291 start_codon:yes stop_codon:yes gene_type:complete